MAQWLKIIPALAALVLATFLVLASAPQTLYG